MSEAEQIIRDRLEGFLGEAAPAAKVA
jgi:hypothetical protein